MFRKTFVWIGLLVVALLIAGCDAPARQNSGTLPQNLQGSMVLPNANNSDRPTQGTMKITTYQASKDAINLVPEINVVPQNDHPAQTALELLVTGSHSPNLVSVIPPGTRVLSLKIKNNIAYANFNDKLIKNNPGGSTEEILLVAAIVDTLTEFPDIQQVQILINGNKIDTIAGHMDTSEPLSRSEKIIKKN